MDTFLADVRRSRRLQQPLTRRVGGQAIRGCRGRGCGKGGARRGGVALRRDGATGAASPGMFVHTNSRKSGSGSPLRSVPPPSASNQLRALTAAPIFPMADQVPNPILNIDQTLIRSVEHVF